MVDVGAVIDLGRRILTSLGVVFLAVHSASLARVIVSDLRGSVRRADLVHRKRAQKMLRLHSAVIYVRSPMASITTLKGGTVEIPKRSTAASFLRRKKIAAALRRFRESLDIDQTTAAARAGVSVWKWKRWEEGETAISLEVLPDIATALAKSAAVVVRELGVAA